MWVARCDSFYTDKNLSPKFESAIDCQSYIDKNLKVLEYLCNEFDSHISGAFDEHRDKIYLHCFKKTNHYIRAYNLSQHRFADGFDF